jgi:predicted nucleic acid-binding protein
MTPSRSVPPLAASATPTHVATLSSARPRVVLDTNVWIDILLFDDPATRPIASALQRGDIDAVQDERCTHELGHVLDYPQFAHYPLDKATTLAWIERLTTRIAPAMCAESGPSAGAGADAAAPTLRRPLPLCRDRDDQKFLELALAAGAHWLLTKDRALLKMARQIARDFGFHIVEPAPFVAATGLAQPASGSVGLALQASGSRSLARPTSGNSSLALPTSESSTTHVCPVPATLASPFEQLATR